MLRGFPKNVLSSLLWFYFVLHSSMLYNTANEIPFSVFHHHPQKHFKMQKDKVSISTCVLITHHVLLYQRLPTAQQSFPPI